MNSSPRFHCGKEPADRRGSTSSAGFSLVEMMVSIAVFSILVVTFASVLSFMNSAWVTGRAKVTDFTRARAMLDLMEHDIQNGLFRSDLPAFPVSNGDTSMEFYTLRSGIPTSGAGSMGVRDVSLVQYGISSGTSTTGVTSTLQRSDSAINWDDNPANTIPFGNNSSFVPTLTPRNTAPGVVALQILFIESNGAISTTYTPIPGPNHTCCIAFAIAVVSDQALLQMNPAQLNSLQSALAGAATGTHSVKADWDTYLNGSTMAWNQYPKSLASDLKTFERYVLLPTNP